MNTKNLESDRLAELTEEAWLTDDDNKGGASRADDGEKRERGPQGK